MSLAARRTNFVAQSLRSPNTQSVFNASIPPNLLKTQASQVSIQLQLSIPENKNLRITPFRHFVSWVRRGFDLETKRKRKGRNAQFQVRQRASKIASGAEIHVTRTRILRVTKRGHSRKPPTLRRPITAKVGRTTIPEQAAFQARQGRF